MPAEEDQASETAPEDKAAGIASPDAGNTRRDWLDERLREEYQDAAEEPLPPRLLALLRKLRPSVH
ncbi:hypothetical protein CR165_14610 [Pseudoroseomonas aestuarii]|uniref:Anti-sigma factor NepR domain-containing protein n=1 Tax=Teichococcus aestuarii TaxID=568898 RepID=A0A2U1V2L4_9PROT|nr:hypothetical protein CR165_14610 [Pseudoroseomonas aestuarii]